MKNKQNTRGAESKKNELVTSLPKMEMYAVLGLELGKKIFKKLENVEETVEILARQKARDLNPDAPEVETDQ